ncbi:ParB/RepB/Spo0J family partition protein [Rhodobacter sp. Har01]|uniref:ParB/RepB/Spo0J family partition protein n=1 Tax=Rhodobacter sp. Har01 TaxID=2883999 RepID=UPI002221431B|nr:ParB N-terminal domain-containing protein [Rhodobacter sp. Har01]
MRIRLSQIDPAALLRDRSTLDPDALAALQASIAAEGLRTPIEVWRLTIPRPPFRYGLIAGLRRLTAFRALAATNPAFATIPATLRTPATLAAAMAAMVTENEIRAQISPWEKGRLITDAVHEGHFDTPDAAVAALYPALTRQARARIRAFAAVVEALDGTLTTPEALTTPQVERLAAALRAGFDGLIHATLAPLRRESLATQWSALAPVLAESLSPRPEPPGPPGRPRRLLHLKQGLTIRREMTRTGWILRFSGPEARSGALIDDVLDQVEAWFQVKG